MDEMFKFETPTLIALILGSMFERNNYARDFDSPFENLL